MWPAPCAQLPATGPATGGSPGAASGHVTGLAIDSACQAVLRATYCAKETLLVGLLPCCFIHRPAARFDASAHGILPCASEACSLPHNWQTFPGPTLAQAWPAAWPILYCAEMPVAAVRDAALATATGAICNILLLALLAFLPLICWSFCLSACAKRCTLFTRQAACHSSFAQSLHFCCS
jgi:hypothetical protein